MCLRCQDKNVYNSGCPSHFLDFFSLEHGEVFTEKAESFWKATWKMPLMKPWWSHGKPKLELKMSSASQVSRKKFNWKDPFHLDPSPLHKGNKTKQNKTEFWSFVCVCVCVRLFIQYNHCSLKHSHILQAYGCWKIYFLMEFLFWF